MKSLSDNIWDEVLKYKNLGKTGIILSSVGIGAFFRAGISDKIIRLLRKALDLGVSWIDTAEAYNNGSSETVVGNAIREDRDKITVVTKVSKTNLKYEDVLKSAEDSKKRLDIDIIDLYLVHAPNPEIQMSETMSAMETLISKGVIRYVGVSNFDVSQLIEAQEALSKHEIVANEVKYNLLERDIEEKVLPYCKKENIGVIAYSPLSKGLLTGRFSECSKVPNKHWRKKYSIFEGEHLVKSRVVVKKLKEIGMKYGKTSAQIAINWLIEKPIVFPVFGASKISQVIENCGSTDWRMTINELDEINETYKSQFT